MEAEQTAVDRRLGYEEPGVDERRADFDPRDRAAERRYGLDEKVNVCAQAASLSRVGVVLASICTADVFVPALDFDKPVAMSLTDVTLETAIRQAGLITVDRE